MRVAFVSGNRELLPDAAIPIGILSVIANLPKRHEAILIDLCFEDTPAEALAESLGAFEPDIVALGMRNIQNADYSGTSNTLAYYDQLIGVIRSTTEAPITIGGAGFSVMPAELMKRLLPDFGISGEAEEAFPALLDRLEAGLGFDGIGNL
ncbi:MAG: cobalamin-dependent protein, partial [Deltaproteobacteria bacterium]|nr:cobalamin-dependent protein [Deltaproteobacteria bacterium]